MANLTLLLTVTTMTETRTEKFFDGATAIAALNAANQHPLTKDVRLVNLVPTGRVKHIPGRYKRVWVKAGGFGGLPLDHPAPGYLPTRIWENAHDVIETREELVWEVLSDQPRWVTGAKAIPTEEEARRDIHRERAAKEFGVAYEDVTPEQRARAKELNFLTANSAPGLNNPRTAEEAPVLTGNDRGTPDA